MNFYKYIDDVELEKPDTWKKHDLKTMPMKDLFKAYKLDE